MRNYWCKKVFRLHADFASMLSKDFLLEIGASVHFYKSYSHEIAVRDRLWHSRVIMDHFRGSAAFVAIPTAMLPFDESTIRCKGRVSTKTYMKIKPVRFGICLYANCRWYPPYLYTFVDNRSENKPRISQAFRYVSVFPSLTGAFNNNNDVNFFPEGSASASWAQQIAHATQAAPLNEWHLVVTDDFFTQNALISASYAGKTVIYINKYCPFEL